MARPHIEAIHYTAAALEEATGGLRGAKWHVLSRDDQDPGAITTVTRLPAEFRGASTDERSLEFFVLDGEVALGGESVKKGRYAYVPVGHGPVALTTEAPALVYLWFGEAGAGGGDLAIVDPDELPWRVSVSEGVEPARFGQVVNVTKSLRRDPVNGDNVGMSVMAPETNQDCAETHQPTDEGFMLRGDMLALDPNGQPTELVVGSYNWRPSDARHLPKYTYTGNLRLFRTGHTRGWDGVLGYYPEPRWPEMVASYKARQRFF